MSSAEQAAPLAQVRVTTASATAAMWVALAEGTMEQVLACVESGADVSSADGNGCTPLHALDRFGAAQASGIALAMMVHGADVLMDDATTLQRITKMLGSFGFGCGPDAADAIIGMHMLPPSLFPLYRDIASKVREAVRNHHRIGLQQDLRDAIDRGDLASLVDALMSGAKPIPVASWEAFDEFEAGIGTVMMVAYGGGYDPSDEATMDRLMLGLSAVGYDCGGDNADALVGMHMLPESLHGLYVTIVAAAARQGRQQRVLN